MKKIIFIILFKSCCLLYSQEKVINVEYGITILEEENLFNNNASLKQLLNNAIKDAKNHSFSLLIQKESSKFYHINSLTTGVNLDNNSPPFVNYSGPTFTLKDTILINCHLIGQKIFILKKPIPNWKITSENKLIDNYKCYKATNTYTVESEVKTFNHPVIAWFCPDLPYSFGPNGYGGLPGLILELQVRNGVYGVKKIDFNSKITFSENELDNIKILTEKEADSILENQMREH